MIIKIDKNEIVNFDEIDISSFGKFVKFSKKSYSDSDDEKPEK